MLRRLLPLAVACVAALTFAAPAAAITTNGQPDNGEHPYVGAMLRSADASGIRCSGTMLSPTVFLTAAHCTAGLLAAGQTTAYVTLDEHYVRGQSTVHRGTMHQDPAYPGNSHDSHDIAVIVLDRPVQLARYGALPTAGQLDRMAARNGLKNQKFDVVGYGTEEADREPGGHVHDGSGSREKAVASFNALNDTWLRLSQNDATGDSGACYGDSGGPNFFAGTNVIAGTTITGDVPCYATNVTYRMDTPSARAFLGRFVTLP